MDVSIIIVNFHTYNLVTACVESIYKHTSGISFEIIVVDNSTDTAEKAKFKSGLPNVKYINPKKNIGFGKANNLGFSKARGKFILALNSDTLFIENSLKDCLSYLQSSYAKEKNIKMIGVKLLNEDGTFQHSFFPFTSNHIWTYFKCSNPILYKLLRVNRKFKEPDNKPIEVGDISGAFMFFEKSLLKTAKGFDPHFFMYYEDTEWCRERIRKTSRIYYLPSTSVIHLGGKSAPKRLMFIQNILSLSLLWYKKGKLNYLSYILLTYLNVATYTLTYFLGGKKQKNISASYIVGYFKIFLHHFYQIPNTAKTNNLLIYKPLSNYLFNKSN